MARPRHVAILRNASGDLSESQHRFPRGETVFVGPELEWTRLPYDKHGVLIVKLTGKYLSSLLSKLRSAERLAKGDPSELALEKLLDTYIRAYLSGSKTIRTARRSN